MSGNDKLNLSEYKFTDVLNYKQEICHQLSMDELQIILNENYTLVLHSLRNGPKTVDEIEEYFFQKKVEKSKKSIYRYLNYLTEVGFVILAGKRVISLPNNKFSSLNIYAKSAKFYFNYKITSELEQNDPETKDTVEQFSRGLHLFLEQFSEKTINYDSFQEKISKILFRKEKGLNSLLKAIPQEKMALLDSFDWMNLNRVLESALWVRLFLEEPSLIEELRKIL